MKIAPVLLLAGSLCVAGCERTDSIAHLFRSTDAWIDLTYGFGEETIYWPTGEPFDLEVVTAGLSEGGYYYASNNFSAAEHGGTHLDAPVHFAEGQDTAAEIPIDRLVGPAVVIDVSSEARADPDYLIGVDHIEAFETDHGPIPDGAIVLFRTGWGKRWPDREAYLGTDMTGPEAVPHLHFPGIDPATARWLVDRGAIDAVGIDTPSIDYGQSATFETHQILYGANIPGFENVANLESMPQTGGYVIALPMKIERGSGGPLRIVGVVPDR